MRQALISVVVLMVLLGPSPAGASVVDRNVQFFLDRLGLDAVPDGPATVYTRGIAEETTAADALRRAAERAGDVDLAAVVASAGHPPMPGNGLFAMGDVWTIELAYGACPTPQYMDTPVPGTTIHPQLHTYDGGLGHQTTASSLSGEIIDWTLKSNGGSYAGVGATVVGQSDFWCSSAWSYRVWFPKTDGVAYTN